MLNKVYSRREYIAYKIQWLTIIHMCGLFATMIQQCLISFQPNSLRNFLSYLWVKPGAILIRFLFGTLVMVFLFEIDKKNSRNQLTFTRKATHVWISCYLEPNFLKFPKTE